MYNITPAETNRGKKRKRLSDADSDTPSAPKQRTCTQPQEQAMEGPSSSAGHGNTRALPSANQQPSTNTQSAVTPSSVGQGSTLQSENRQPSTDSDTESAVTPLAAGLENTLQSSNRQPSTDTRAKVTLSSAGLENPLQSANRQPSTDTRAKVTLSSAALENPLQSANRQPSTDTRAKVTLSSAALENPLQSANRQPSTDISAKVTLWSADLENPLQSANCKTSADTQPKVTLLSAGPKNPLQSANRKTSADTQSAMKSSSAGLGTTMQFTNQEQQSTENTSPEKPQRGNEVLLKELKQLTKDSKKETVIQLLRITNTIRSEEFENINPRLRLNHLRDNYRLFLNPDFIIEALLLLLHGKSLTNIKDTFQIKVEEIVDFVCGKGLIKAPRSAIKTEDQKIMTAMVHLPVIFQPGKGKEKSADGGLKLHNTLVHVPKPEETIEDITKLHRNCNYPWVFFNRVGDEKNVSFLIMIKDKLFVKTKSAFEALMVVMGIYYITMLAYPTLLQGSLLFIQDEILGDTLHTADKQVLTKSMRGLTKFREETQRFSNGLDGLF